MLLSRISGHLERQFRQRGLLTSHVLSHCADLRHRLRFRQATGGHVASQLVGAPIVACSAFHLQLWDLFKRLPIRELELRLIDTFASRLQIRRQVIK